MLVKSPLSTFPTWVWAPEGCRVCILSRECEAVYQQWLHPHIGHPKKMLANFRPSQLGCSQLFFFFLIMAGKAQKWLARARVGTEKNEQVSCSCSTKNAVVQYFVFNSHRKRLHKLAISPLQKKVLINAEMP